MDNEFWINSLKGFGLAAPFLLCLIIAVVALWKKIQTYDDKVGDILNKAIAALAESNSLHREVLESLDRANVQSHQLAGRPMLDPEIWRRVLVQLEILERKSA